MKILHVFAGPYPTPQGTQVLVGQLCRLLAGAGHEVHLLCYAHGRTAGNEPFTVHRIPDWPRFQSTRSGPALKKIPLDVLLAAWAARLVRALQPDIVHAHHYEALVAARLATWGTDCPLVFHLHALFGGELPTYFPPRWKRPITAIGRLVDAQLPRTARKVAAVSGDIAEALKNSGLPEDRIALVRPPCDIALAIRPQTVPERNVVTGCYSGNLDAYQNMDGLIAALAQIAPRDRRHLRIEIVTDSDSAALTRDIAERCLDDLVDIVPHGSPEQAFRRLAAADFSIIPRCLSGGAPIKLVNALGLGLPVLADQRIADGLISGEEIYAVNMADRAAVAAAIKRLATDEQLRRRLSFGARRAAQRRHDPSQVLSALAELYR